MSRGVPLARGWAECKHREHGIGLDMGPVHPTAGHRRPHRLVWFKETGEKLHIPAKELKYRYKKDTRNAREQNRRLYKREK